MARSTPTRMPFVEQAFVSLQQRHPRRETWTGGTLSWWVKMDWWPRVTTLIWNKRQSRTTRDLNALAYVNKRLWAVGERGTVLLATTMGFRGWPHAPARTRISTRHGHRERGHRCWRKRRAGVLGFFMYWWMCWKRTRAATPRRRRTGPTARWRRTTNTCSVAGRDAC